MNRQSIYLTKHLTAMRTIHLIVIHCSATKENDTLTEIELEVAPATWVKWYRLPLLYPEERGYKKHTPHSEAWGACERSQY